MKDNDCQCLLRFFKVNIVETQNVVLFQFLVFVVHKNENVEVALLFVADRLHHAIGRKLFGHVSVCEIGDMNAIAYFQFAHFANPLFVVSLTARVSAV